MFSRLSLVRVRCTRRLCNKTWGPLATQDSHHLLSVRHPTANCQLFLVVPSKREHFNIDLFSRARPTGPSSTVGGISQFSGRFGTR